MIAPVVEEVEEVDDDKFVVPDDGVIFNIPPLDNVKSHRLDVKLYVNLKQAPVELFISNWRVGCVV